MNVIARGTSSEDDAVLRFERRKDENARAHFGFDLDLIRTRATTEARKRSWTDGASEGEGRARCDGGRCANARCARGEERGVKGAETRDGDARVADVGGGGETRGRRRGADASAGIVDRDDE